MFETRKVTYSCRREKTINLWNLVLLLLFLIICKPQ